MSRDPETSSNPFLAPGAHDRLPPFESLAPSHIEPGIRALTERVLAGIADLEANAAPTWQRTIAALEALTEPLFTAWGVVQHLMGVQNSPELRAAHDAVQKDVVQTSMRLAQSEPIYRAMRALKEGPAWNELDAAQQRIVFGALRDAELSGVGLAGAPKQRFEQIELELAELSTRFTNNVLDETKAFSMMLTTPQETAGLPPTLLAATAQGKDGEGPWNITLDAPVLLPFMEHSQRRDLRERLYRANVTRASSGERDNLPLVETILRLRQEKARILGRGSFADVSLASKMAPGVAAVDKLLAELRDAALPRARGELEELTTYAQEKSADAKLDLALWDVPFWAERLREERYAYSDEELRPYFSLPKVLEGLFATAKRLFEVEVRPADGTVSVWDSSVRYFHILDASGRDVASFYLDPYSRPANKRGGAWMDVALSRRRRDDGTVRLPVAYLICNMTTPVGDKPSLMTFREVETLFHEFGHGLQHMLTTVDYAGAAGINNVEWDAVELPSQFMENWCYTEDTMKALARHYVTGEPLPKALFDKIVAARNYRAGSATLRQVYFATLDLALHREVPGRPVLDLQRSVAERNTVLAPLAEDRFLCSFSHIFAGGYAAGYYSYKWAEVLSADAFAAFRESGLDDPSAVLATGRRFRRTVLALGGSRHPMDVFREFRGREPSTRPLLEQTGLIS
ncbi:MAG TPA: M3 family metallopeptidase [Polyangiaceae bacterium]|nr:M3 family metallopeptidase [Polyangiaceae bacterium]